MSEITLTDQNWDEWCMPCRMISPVVEEISNEYQDRVKVGELNVDENPLVAGRYGIRGIPTVLFLKK